MKRNISGILILDKPADFSSNDVLQKVKRIFAANKAGHTGSLDPIATGMLPICFGEATKFSQFLFAADKHYRVIGKLGETTTTADIEGEIVLKRAVKNITVNNVDQALPKFRGKQLQIPPMYSAIKYRGQPLYKLARKGIEVERQPREIVVHSLQLLSLTDDLVEFEIHCSKGTYVRTLVADIGEVLGCGAHVVALRRLTVGSYKEQEMITMSKLEECVAQETYQLLDQLLLPIETMLVDMPEVILTRDMFFYMQQGQSLLIPHKLATGLVKLQNKDKSFLGIGEIMDDGKVAPRKICKF